VSKRKKKQTHTQPVSKNITVIEPGLAIDSSLDNKLNFEKKYLYESPNGSNTEITMKANIENLDIGDLHNILQNFASRTRNFYISLGNEINNKPL
jgi:hypothetical protein